MTKQKQELSERLVEGYNAMLTRAGEALHHGDTAPQMHRRPETAGHRGVLPQLPVTIHANNLIFNVSTFPPVTKRAFISTSVGTD